MSKFGLKVVIVLLGFVFCMGLLQGEASAESIAIALRAPTSKHHQLVEFPGTQDEKALGKILALSLPKNTSISFCVDQVNTVLYEVKIKVTEEKPKEEKLSKPFDFSKAIASIGGIETLIKKAPTLLQKSSSARDGEGEGQENNLTPDGQNNNSDSELSLINALVNLKEELEKASELNKKLDEFLYRTEDPEFYNCGVTEVNDKFDGIRMDAKSATAKYFSQGTSQAIYEAAKVAIQGVRDAAKALDVEAALGLPKDLSDTSNDIATAFRTVAEKLRAIETATWSKFDTETRILKNQIKFTCVFTPKEETPKLQPITRVVTITGVPTGWIITGTQGVFVSGLIDETSANESGEGDDVRLSTGALIHAFHSKFKYGGLTAGLGVDSAKNPQVALGVSFLINADEERLFALTFGGMAGRVKIYNGNGEGGQANRISWFGAITFNFNSLFDEKGGQ